MNALAPHEQPVTSEQWAACILGYWGTSVKAMIATGRAIAEAKKALPYGEFTTMVETNLRFSRRKAQILMEIAADPRLLDAQIIAHLPPMWTALHAITKLDDNQLHDRIADGTIRPDMLAQDIACVVKRQQRANREKVLGVVQCALPVQKFGVIVADPEWRFEPWSRETGMDRAADNHYPTSCTEVITSRDVASIAADDCVLFLWATAPMLPHALTVMAAWGFDYKSHCIWDKAIAGTGYWFRSRHELLLVGTKGKIPAPAMGDQEHSVIACQKGEHSAKPEIFLRLIELYFPTLRKIELNRRGSARLGWAAWGLEAQTEVVA
jgi:N6-adenosine-specific RNA methylase IME4